MALKPTTYQWAIASDAILIAWRLLCGLGVTCASLAFMELAVTFAWTPWLVLLVVFCLVLSFLVGLLVALPIALVVLGPIYYWQGVANGGPFEPGDVVQVICGEHAGRVSRVYAPWRFDAVRVELGAENESHYQDIFGPHQLLRVSDAGHSRFEFRRFT